MLLFLILSGIIFFASRGAINEIYRFLRKFTDNNYLAFSVISLIFLPGTIVHEASHFLAALFLLLPVKKMSVFPEFENGEIKLGKVVFERRDFLRAVVVGIAPFFVGIAALFFIFSSDFLFRQNLLVSFLVYYLVFSISSNMFSSKEDLKDLVFLIPLILLIAVVFYILGINILTVTNSVFYSVIVNDILNKINYYFSLTLVIHISVIIIFKLANLTIKNHEK